MSHAKFFSLILCASLTYVAGMARADDTEIFFGSSAASGTKTQPNVVLVFDTSGSMQLEQTKGRKDYNPATTYSAGGCVSGYVYYAVTGSGIPSCSSSNKIAVANFYCTPATKTAFLSADGGKYVGNGIRWIQEDKIVKTGKKTSTTTTTYYWSNNLAPQDSTSGSTTYDYTAQNYITCEDNTDHSMGYALNGATTTSNNQWKGTSTDNWFSNSGNTRVSYTFYDSNWLAYQADSSQVISLSRMDVVKTSAKSLIDSLSGVNVGIMRYSANNKSGADGNGGMVIAEVQDVTMGASTLKSAITNMHPGGYTPLAETLFEAYQYYAGKDVIYGLSSTSCKTDSLGLCSDSNLTSSPSVSGSRTGNTYNSPITDKCQKNYIVFLTDGLPNNDSAADSTIEGLDIKTSKATKTTDTGCYRDTSTMWTALGYSSTPSITYYDGSTGLCLKEMARNLKEKDLTGLPDSQNVTTFFIGFGDNVGKGAPQDYLDDAAKGGGGAAYLAGDADELATAFDKTLGGILSTSASFTAPSVAVNSFNKTQVLEDLYVAMFEPSKTAHWPGNVKKFKLRDGVIIGQDKNNAVDSTTGFFKSSAMDFWQSTSDTQTNITTKGGAANVIPAPDPSATAPRSLYTYLGANKPGAAKQLSDSPITSGNSAITTSLLNIGGASDPDRDELINWARGDADGDLTTTGDVRHQMGDPIHSQPSVVIYGGTKTSKDVNDAVVYVATNDGYLHAIDVSSGKELWAYIPQELLGDLKKLYADDTTTPKHYSLDGDIRVLKYDTNGDGVVTPSENDRVFLYFSQGRGGDRYYALDVTDKKNPKFMWSLGNTDLGGVVKLSWSTPALGRVKVDKGTGQNTQKLVLIFGGGYDNAEEAQTYVNSDTSGNGIFMVDAINGTLLWSQTKASTGAFANMSHAIPSNVTVLDTDNDGWTDRMYVGDMAGQIWRFDISNGQPEDKLVAGGVIASLGGKISSTTADNRSFYNAPDVAFFTVNGGSNYYNIAIGSGDRALPKSNVTTQDRFYSIRDYHLGPIAQSIYDDLKPIKDSDLAKVDGKTTVAFSDQSPGWKLVLDSTEKALSQSVTVDGTVMFSTYLPSASSDSCTASTGTGRTYSVDAGTGLSHFDSLYESFNTTGLPPPITIINEDNIVRTDGSTSGTTVSGASSKKGTCLSGVNIMGNCVDFGSKIKTFWQDSGAQ